MCLFVLGDSEAADSSWLLNSCILNCVWSATDEDWFDAFVDGYWCVVGIAHFEFQVNVTELLDLKLVLVWLGEVVWCRLGGCVSYEALLGAVILANARVGILTQMLGWVERLRSWRCMNHSCKVTLRERWHHVLSMILTDTLVWSTARCITSANRHLTTLLGHFAATLALSTSLARLLTNWLDTDNNLGLLFALFRLAVSVYRKSRSWL